MSGGNENSLIAATLDFCKFPLLKAVLQQNHQKKSGVYQPSQDQILEKRTSKSKKLDYWLKSGIKNGNFRRVEILIREGANINKRGVQTWTPLHTAVQFGHHRIAKLLIKNGAHVNSVLSGPEEPDGPKITGSTPLHLAAMWNHLKCAKILLKSGANVSLKTETDCLAINMAVCKNHQRMVELLLNYGASINSRFSNGFFKVFAKEMHENLWLDHELPLLHFSILKKLKNITKMLLDRGADPNSATAFGKTALMQAVEVNDVETVKLLISKGAKVNGRDAFGQPVLHFTMINTNRKISIYSKEEYELSNEKLKILTHLVDAGADINAKFPFYEDLASVIHYMISYGFDLGVFYLLNQEDLNAEAINFKTVSLGRCVEANFTSENLKDLNFVGSLRKSFSMVTKFLVQWAVGRQLMGLPVDERILLEPIYHGMTKEDHKAAVDLIKSCSQGQVDFMKQTRIGDGSLTFWSLLTCDMDELVDFLAHDDTRYLEIINENKAKIIHFAQLLINRVVGRKRIFGSSASGFSSDFSIEQLVDNCCDKIFNFRMG